MLHQLKLKTRMSLLLLVAAVGTLVLAVVALIEARSSMDDDYQRSIRLLVETAHSGVVKLHDQEVSGELTRAEAQARAKELLRNLRYGDGDYYYIWSLDGVGVMHPFRPDFEGQSLLGKIMFDDGQRDLIGEMVALMRTADEGYLMTEFPRQGGNKPLPKLQFVKKFAPWGWMIGSGIYVDDIDRVFMEHAKRLALVCVVIIVAMGLVAWRIARSVVHELGGEPREAMRIMREAAEGNLAVEMGDAAPGSLLASLGGMLKRLREMMAQIGDNAQEVASSSSQIAAMTSNVADASVRQSDASSAIAAAIEEMTVSINHISDSAQDTRTNSSQAAELANRGESRATSAATEIRRVETTVEEASKRISHLVDRANEIGSIANVIKEIASQTNLLALNAAIEAARAGEQGRGFAVVADEVRGLAERTAEATVKIEQMISGIQSDTSGAVEVMSHVTTQVHSGVELVEEAANSLKEIRAGAAGTLERIGDVADATREQSTASDAIAAQVEQIAQMVDDTSNSVREAAGAVQQLENLSAQLHAMVGRFQY